jgi:hypothetical protein
MLRFIVHYRELVLVEGIVVHQVLRLSNERVGRSELSYARKVKLDGWSGRTFTTLS